jgi:hypothetical protein
VQGWNVSDAGLKSAAVSTTGGIMSYYSARTSGAKSIKNVYTTDLSKVSVKDLRSKLKDLTGEVKFWTVPQEKPIKDFVEEKTKKPYTIGSGWYQLTKPETVQSYKQIVIRTKDTKEVFGGAEARRLIGIDPTATGDVKVVPGNHSAFDVFLQSTSVNRKLVRGTDVMFLMPTGPVRETWDSAAAKAAADAKVAQQKT